jgi:transposase InsO family protein
MKSAQLIPVCKLNFISTLDSNHTVCIAPNLLNQNFNVTLMNEIWVADITYIRTKSGWICLAAMMDLYARKIAGWTLAPHMRSNLVCSALNTVIIAQPPPSLICT